MDETRPFYRPIQRTELGRSHSPDILCKRRVKSLSQAILLLGVRITESQNDLIGMSMETAKCDILSESDRAYTITLKKSKCLSEPPLYSFEVTCSCPDYVNRKQNCKHIFWLGYHRFGVSDPSMWSWCDIIDFFDMYHDYQVVVGRNENCPICLEHMDYEREHLICCEECSNAVHVLCLGRYTIRSRNSNCVLCRHSYNSEENN